MNPNLTVSMVLKLVEQVTAPARVVKSALQDIGATTERVGRSGVEWSNQQIAANQARRSALMGEAFAATAMAGAVGAMLKPAIDFERAMDGVGAVANASNAELDILTSTARDLGANTNWGASEAAEGMKFLAMAGLETSEIVAAMPGMLNLASAGATDLGRASDIASNILSGFTLDASEMVRVADVMTNTFTSSNTDVAMLGETMKYVAPVANSLGIDLEQTAAMAGLLGNAGIQGSQAGTGLRAMMSRLAAPTKDAQRALNALGVDTLDANGNMRDFYTVLEEIDAGLQKFGSGEQQDLISAIAGLEAASAATVLLDQAGSGALRAYTETLKETGSAARVASKMTDNVAGDLKRVQSVSESLAISVGTVLLPELAALLEAVVPIVTAVQQWAEANPELISLIARLVAGFVAFKLASIALRFALFSALMPFLHIIRAGSWMLVLLPKLVTGLAMLLNPLALVRGAMIALRLAFIATGIGALLAGVAMAGVWIYNNWSGLKAFFIGLWEGFREALGPAAPLLDGVVAAVQTLFGWLSDLLGPIGASQAEWSEWGRNVGASIGGFVALVVGFPATIIDALKSAWGTVSDWVSNMWSGLSDSATNAWAGLKGTLVEYSPAALLFVPWSGLAQWVADMWPDIGAVAETAWKALKLVLASYTPAGLIYTHWEGIANWFAALWEKLPSIDWAALINLEGIQRAWGTVTDWLGNAASGIWDLIPEMPEWEFSLWGDDEIEDPKTLLAAAEAANELEQQFPRLTDAAQQVLADVQDILRAVVDLMQGVDLEPYGAAMTLSIASGMLSQLDAVRAASKQIGAAVTSGLPAAVNVGMGGRVLSQSALRSRVDNRSMLAAHGGNSTYTRQGDTISIHITAAPGSDEQAIAAAVRQELDNRARHNRGGLHDGDGWDE